MASTEGGVEIEKVAEETPEKILTAEIDPALGGQAYQGRKMAFQLGLEGKQINQFASVFVALSKMFEECDLSLLEINPLVASMPKSLSMVMLSSDRKHLQKCGIHLKKTKGKTRPLNLN